MQRVLLSSIVSLLLKWNLYSTSGIVNKKISLKKGKRLTAEYRRQETEDRTQKTGHRTQDTEFEHRESRISLRGTLRCSISTRYRLYTIRMTIFSLTANFSLGIIRVEKAKSLSVRSKKGKGKREKFIVHCS